MSSQDPGAGIQYHFRLYIAGEHLKSRSAYASLKSICEDYLHGRYTLEVVDLLKDPEREAEDQIIAIPTLVRVRPQPVRRLIGDLSDRKRVIVYLELQVEEAL